MASLYQFQGHLSEAEPLFKRALAARERVLGPEHPLTLRSMHNLSTLYQAQGRYSEAEPLLKRALAARERVLGPEHTETLRAVGSLGSLYHFQGRFSEAEPLYQHALAARERVLGPEHPETLASVSSLARALLRATGLGTRRAILAAQHYCDCRACPAERTGRRSSTFGKEKKRSRAKQFAISGSCQGHVPSRTGRHARCGGFSRHV